MWYKLEQRIVPPPGTDTTVASDFEISESSSKLLAFFPRKTKCTPALQEHTLPKFRVEFHAAGRRLGPLLDLPQAAG